MEDDLISKITTMNTKDMDCLIVGVNVAGMNRNTATKCMESTFAEFKKLELDCKILVVPSDFTLTAVHSGIVTPP